MRESRQPSGPSGPSGPNEASRSRESAGRVVLVTGGARSGKSSFAERLARESCRSPSGVTYLATMIGMDRETRERIAAHRLRRPPGWRVVECGPGLDAWQAVQSLNPPCDCLILECLTTLVSRLLTSRRHTHGATREAALDAVRRLIEAARARSKLAVLVTNEVGMGVVPATPLGRRFRDLLGEVNQLAAREADEVYLLVAGLPLRLK